MHVTRGGDLERRKKFVPEYDVPGTFSLASLHSQLYVFGSADLAATMPIDIQYHRLDSGSPMAAILDVKSFAGKLYVIAEYANGQVYHYYNGARVVDWDTTAATDANAAALCTLMAAKISGDSAVTATSFGATITVRARVAGTPFTISGPAVLTPVQANVVAVTETRAHANVQISSGPGEITSLLIGATELLATPITWATSNDATATNLAAAIRAGYATHGYSAAAINDTVTITAAVGTGATPNGSPVNVVTQSGLAIVADATLAGGVTAVDAVAQVYTASFGVFATATLYTTTINGTSYVATGQSSGVGRSLYVDKNRVWSPVGSLERYCKLNDAAVWASGDAGFINIASQTEGNEPINVVARYQGLAAFFTSNNIILYQLDVDPTKFVFSNVLESTGTTAPLAVVRYGNNDVFYIDVSGIRSLRARDASNAAFVSDVGNQIDPFVLEYLDTLTVKQITTAVGTLEPRDGRYWLIVGTRIFVLSFFPGAKISAWTYYEAEEFGTDPVQAVAKVGKQVFVRAGDSIYAYGGLDGTAYPEDAEIVCDVQTQFLSGNTPATIKELTGFDLAATNTWTAEAAYNPNQPDATINIGSLNKISYENPNKISLVGETAMISLVLTCSKAGPATLSMATVHYEGDEAG